MAVCTGKLLVCDKCGKQEMLYIECYRIVDKLDSNGNSYKEREPVYSEPDEPWLVCNWYGDDSACDMALCSECAKSFAKNFVGTPLEELTQFKSYVPI